MKNTLIILLSLVANLSFAKKNVPPAKAQTAFKAIFSKAEKAKWDKDGKDSYEVNFVDGGVSKSANFSPNGDWQETETEIAANALPKNITEAILKKYPKSKIVGAAKIELGM